MLIMKKRTKVLTSISIMLIIFVGLIGNALAGNEAYDTGLLNNTGQTHNQCTGNYNFKVYAGVRWKIKCTDFSCSGDEGAGINFQPKYYSGGYINGGKSKWIDEEVDYEYVSTNNNMDIGRYYYLFARIDDDKSGPMRAIGKWNSN